jgi:hypothetical protein
MGQPDNEWIPVARMPDRFRDGRALFVWAEGRPFIVRFEGRYCVVVDDYHPAGGNLDVSTITHFAPMMLGPNNEEAAF